MRPAKAEAADAHPPQRAPASRNRLTPGVRCLRAKASCGRASIAYGQGEASGSFPKALALARLNPGSRLEDRSTYLLTALLRRAKAAWTQLPSSIRQKQSPAATASVGAFVRTSPTRRDTRETAEVGEFARLGGGPIPREAPRVACTGAGRAPQPVSFAVPSVVALRAVGPQTSFLRPRPPGLLG